MRAISGSARVVPRLTAAMGEAALGRAKREAIAGIDHERRADDEHGVGRVELGEGALDPRARDAFAEEHDVGLQRPAASRARGNHEIREVRALEIGVAVGAVAASRARTPGLRRASRSWSPSRSVLSPQPRQRTRSSRPSRSIAVRLPAGLMQAVDVLGD